MSIHTGYFDHPETHHKGWFRVFRTRGIAEVWAGHYYITICWW